MMPLAFVALVFDFSLEFLLVDRGRRRNQCLHTLVSNQANKTDRIKGPGLENLGCAVYNAGLFGYKMRIQGTQDFYVDQVRNR